MKPKRGRRKCIWAREVTELGHRHAMLHHLDPRQGKKRNSGNATSSPAAASTPINSRADDRRQARSQDRSLPRRLSCPQAREIILGERETSIPCPIRTLGFSAVHFTPRMDGSIRLGRNAVLAFAREGYSFFTVFNPSELWDAVSYPGFIKLATKYWKIGAGEMYRDLVRSAYIKGLQRYIPELQAEDCLPGGTVRGARAGDGEPTVLLRTTSFSTATSTWCTCATRHRPPRRRRLRSGNTSWKRPEKRFDLSRIPVSA